MLEVSEQCKFSTQCILSLLALLHFDVPVAKVNTYTECLVCTLLVLQIPQIDVDCEETDSSDSKKLIRMSSLAPD